MRNFIFWTGIVSVFAGVSFQFPFLSSQLLPSEQQGMLMHIFGMMAVFIGIMLILCTRDLKKRGTLVIWEGVLRLGGGATMVGYGLFGSGGMLLVGSGLFDFTIGVIYLIGLPRYLGTSFVQLLLDNKVGTSK